MVIRKKKIISEKLKYFNVNPRYAISKIDCHKMRIGMVEYGMAFYLPFNELYQYLNIIDELFSRDVLIFGFLIGKYDRSKNIQLNREENNEQGHAFILESEDRAGRFKIYDINAKCLITISFADLLQNRDILKKMDRVDLLQIGMIAGKNKINVNALKGFED